jgi:hypothetical protein
MKTVVSPSKAQAPTFLESVEQALGNLVAEQQRQAGSELGPFRGDDALAPEESKSTPQFVELEVTIDHLTQIKEWLQRDQHLLTVIDDYVGKHVGAQTRALKRQNALLSVGMTLVGAILGWLLSILLPVSFLTIPLH